MSKGFELQELELMRQITDSNVIISDLEAQIAVHHKRIAELELKRVELRANKN